jgi:Domain of unknown function (DUF4160)
VPTIAEFLGIKITIFYRDHPPMHVHVVCQGHECRVSIESGAVLDGHLPVSRKRLIKDWVLANQQALIDNWSRAERREPLERLEGPK